MMIEPLESRFQLSVAAPPTATLTVSPMAPLAATTPPGLHISNTVPANALLPDLTPWASRSKDYIYGWQFDTNSDPGHTLLRLTSAMANGGAGPLELIGGPPDPSGGQDVYQRIYSPDGSYVDHLAGIFTYHPEHHHTHFDDFAMYRLRQVTQGNGSKTQGVGKVVASGSKTSFCLTDSDVFNGKLPNVPAGTTYDTCDATIQGISVGWADVYDQSLPNQWIDVTSVKPGQYWLEVVANPNHHLIEAGTANNATRILVTIPGTTTPSNDNFADRASLTGRKRVVRASNIGASLEPGEPKISGQGGSSLWWSWTAPRSGTVAITTAGSKFDTLLGVYTGNVLSSLKQVRANDDTRRGLLTSTVSFRAKAGKTYDIAVGGYRGANGSIRLSLSEK